jgi:hypothetical protein
MIRLAARPWWLSRVVAQPVVAEAAADAPNFRGGRASHSLPSRPPRDPRPASTSEPSSVIVLANGVYDAGTPLSHAVTALVAVDACPNPHSASR